jgi:hypothetical protein
MTAQRPIPHYVQDLSDLERYQATVAIKRRWDSPTDMDVKLPAGVTAAAGAVLGLGLCALVAMALQTAPVGYTDVAATPQGRMVGADIERNAATLRRSRAWWERYGQGHTRTNALAAR